MEEMREVNLIHEISPLSRKVELLLKSLTTALTHLDMK